MNKVILSGRLCRDIELKYVGSSNKASVKNTLAVDGYGEHTDFINVVFWEKTAETVSKYLQKGRKIVVEGRLSVRSFEDNNNQKVWITEVVVISFEFADSKNGEGGNQSQGNNQQSQTKHNTSDEKFVPVADDDDELPF